MAKGKNGRSAKDREPAAIAEIQVAGFKSISDEQRIEIRPLTILAGANSSGKSSVMQPLLLLKQTLEAPYDAGPLLLNGPNVKFTSAEQLLSRIGKRRLSDLFGVKVGLENGEYFGTSYLNKPHQGLQLERMDVSGSRGTFSFWAGMTQDEIVETGVPKGWDTSGGIVKGKQGRWEIMRENCFLLPVFRWTSEDQPEWFPGWMPHPWPSLLQGVIHLPGLRGNPERSYPMTGIGPLHRGTFETYTASLIYQWMSDSTDKLAGLNADLKLLGLGAGVAAARLNDVQIELQIGRLPDVPPTRPEDRVNIADVGVGVSQTLPVLVALRAAQPGQLVYIEQPETHLHPRAQFALAQVLASAALRGVRVVVETHSSTLLLGVQTLVAEGKLAPEKVKLHWFERAKDGRTKVRSGELDDAGAFGDWPEDFDDEMPKVQKRYLDAASERLFAR